jgi:hypothetical protein
LLVGGALLAVAASIVGAVAVAEPAAALPRDCIALRNEADDDLRWSRFYLGVGNAFYNIGAYDEAEVSYGWAYAYATLADEVRREARGAGC